MSSLIVEVCKIKDVRKHPNADKLSLATVKGWQVIVGLNQYKDGELIVFCPPDCIIPDDIIDKYNLEYLKKNGRTSTVKLRGYISQGLILDLPDGKWREGDNVADKLGIIKYEPPEPKFAVSGSNNASKKRINPNFHRYTDIENIKNFNNIFTEDAIVVVTEKIHGANARYGMLEIEIREGAPLLDKISMWFRKNILGKKFEFVYGSHNVQITKHSNRNSFYGDDVWGKMGEKYNIKDILPENTVIYGEVYGQGIQDLTYGIDGHDLIVFDVKVNGEYQDWSYVVGFCKEHGLKHVPELYIGHYTDDLLEKYTSGNSVLCPNQIREGCVIKTIQEENHPRVGRKILKSVSETYLTRKNGTEYK